MYVLNFEKNSQPQKLGNDGINPELISRKSNTHPTFKNELAKDNEIKSRKNEYLFQIYRHKKNVATFNMFFGNYQHDVIFYRNYESYDAHLFKEELYYEMLKFHNA